VEEDPYRELDGRSPDILQSSLGLRRGNEVLSVEIQMTRDVVELSTV
jgi:hypothetical protein